MILSSDLRFQERLRASYRRTAPTCSSSRGVVCELEEERQAGLRELHQPFRVFARLPSGAKSFQRMDRQ